MEKTDLDGFSHCLLNFAVYFDTILSVRSQEPKMNKIEKTSPLNLKRIRRVLIRQEETIIFALTERAQFKVNPLIYRGGAILDSFEGSFVDYLLLGTEKLHATVRRYSSPDEHPFFDQLPDPILEPLDFKETVLTVPVNLNAKIKEVYENEIVPAICDPGDDKQYGSSAVCDVNVLQAISKRIHYGKFVAESKYISDPDTFATLIKNRDRRGICRAVTHRETEEKLLDRVEFKASMYGKDLDEDRKDYKIQPEFIRTIYKKWLIPLTKEVEIQYLMNRI